MKLKIISRLLIVILSSCLFRVSISSRLTLSAFPEFKTVISSSYLYGSTFTLDDPSKYSLDKLIINDIPVIKLTYSFNRKIILSKKQDTQSHLAWTIVNNEKPLTLLSFAVHPDTESELQRLVDSFPDQRIQGLANVLEYMNSIAWSKSLLKKFYRKCVYPRLHINAEDSSAREIKYTELMLQSKSKLDAKRIMGENLFKVNNEQNSITSFYAKSLVHSFEMLVLDLFKVLADDVKVEIWAIGTRYDKYWPEIISETGFIMEELIQFRDAMMKISDDFKEEILQFVRDSPENQKYFNITPNVIGIYDQHIAPILRDSLFPLFQILFRQLEHAHSVGKSSEYIRHLYSQFKSQTEFSGLGNRTHYIENDIIFDFIEDTFKQHGYASSDVPELSARLKEGLKKLIILLKQELKKLTGLDEDFAWRFIRSRVTRILEMHLHRTPAEVFVVGRIMELFVEDDNGFGNSEIQRKFKLFQKNKHFLRKLLYLTGLLGGKAFGHSKSTASRFFFFKLQSNPGINKFLV